jgi:hypothetical protein
MYKLMIEEGNILNIACRLNFITLFLCEVSGISITGKIFYM